MSFTWASSMWRKGESKGKTEDKGEKEQQDVLWERHSAEIWNVELGEALV